MLLLLLLLLLLLRGDGTALVQTRQRSCSECDPDELPWEPVSTVQECELMGVEELAAACESEEGCRWWPRGNLGSCTDIDEPTCEEAAAIVTGG
ncbi:MAG: hypothetical protein AB1Z98_30590 [Nannocystaceae bacterium]